MVREGAGFLRGAGFRGDIETDRGGLVRGEYYIYNIIIQTGNMRYYW